MEGGAHIAGARVHRQVRTAPSPPVCLLSEPEALIGPYILWHLVFVRLSLVEVGIRGLSGYCRFADGFFSQPHGP